MEIRLPPEKEARLSHLASALGPDAATLAGELLGESVEEEIRFLAAVKSGEAELDRGEFLTHEEMAASLERLVKG